MRRSNTNGTLNEHAQYPTMLIVDSMAANYRYGAETDYGTSLLSVDGSTRLGGGPGHYRPLWHVASMLKWLHYQYHLAIIVTNQVRMTKSNRNKKDKKCYKKMKDTFSRKLTTVSIINQEQLTRI
jgi:hypothetical protein